MNADKLQDELHHARMLIDVTWDLIESEVEHAGTKARLIVLLDHVDAHLRTIEQEAAPADELQAREAVRQ